MKKHIALLLVLAMVMTLFGCSSGNQPAATEAPAAPAATEAPAAPADDTIVIGVSMPQLDADGFAANVIGVRMQAETYGNIKLIVSDAQQSVDTQMSHFEDFITQGVDAIICTPVDSAAVAAAVSMANNAGIPVVSMDRSVEGAQIAALIESNNYAHGARCADLILAAAEAQGKTAADIKALNLMGAQSASSGVERHEGFMDRCAELGITVVSSLPTEWSADTAYSATMDAMQAHPEINAIYEASDIALHSGVEAALTQLNLLKKVGEEGHIIIVGVDGGPSGMNAVRNGYIDGMAQQQLLFMGQSAVDVAVKAVKGETIAESVIRLDPVGVTAENVDDELLWPNAIK